MPEPEDNLVRIAPGVRVHPDALVYTAVRSEGPGGQNVNKRATRVQLRVRADDLGLAPDARARLDKLLPGGITADGDVLLASSATRSQARNRADVLDHLCDLVRQAQVRPKARRATKPTKGSIRRRLESKKHRSDAKQRRRPPKSDEM